MSGRAAQALAVVGAILLASVCLPSGAAASALAQPSGCHSPTVPALGASTPVLLVHGFNEGPSVWNQGTTSMLDAIGAIPGVKVVAFNYYGERTNWVTDPRIGACLAVWITSLANSSKNAGGPGKVIIVAHSMGGLAVRCAVDPACVNRVNTGSPRPAASFNQIRLLVTLGTPNLGSLLANLGSPVASQSTTLARIVVSSVCKTLPHCEQLASLDGTAAGVAMREGSPELDPNYPKPDPNLLKPLPATIPLYPIAGKITLTTSLFGSPFDIPIGDIGDVVVPLNSALAETPSSTIGSGAVSGSSTIIDCGTIPIDHIDLWGATKGILSTGHPYLTCWHLTETTDPVWQAAVVAAIRAAVTTPGLYIRNSYELGSLFRYPRFPAIIGLDNSDSLSGLRWAQVSSDSATAKGSLNVDNCTPDCASGSNIKYPIELLASDPQHCIVTVYKQYSTVSKQENTYVFNKMRLKALGGNPPSQFIGSTPSLPPACGTSPPVPTPVPTPSSSAPSHSASPTPSSSPKSKTVTVTIPADAGWVDTRISLNRTDSVTISASGSWTPDGVDYTGPDGFGYSMMSPDNYRNISDLGVCGTCATSAYPEWAALMFYMGSDPPQPGSYTSTAVAPQADRVDYVGSSLTTTKSWPYPGELWLGINDDAYSGNTSDNYGQVTAVITVTPSS
jgi:hypothetical protein